MKVLIIGARGMLGQELVKVFDPGNQVLAWDREDADITDLQATTYKIEAEKPQLLINAAAYNDVDRAESEPEVANQINGYAVGNLAKICKALDIPLVHYSTDNVFDGRKKAGYREEDEPNPLSTYGRSKFLGEQELIKNTDKYYLIRLSRLFGRPGKSAAGKKSFVYIMLSLTQEKSEIDVVDDEVAALTYAYDAAEQTKYIVERKMPFGIYHCANSGGATWYEFAREIFKVVGTDVKLNPVSASRFPRPARRPKYSILLNTKLPLARSWQEALREYLAEYKP